MSLVYYITYLTKQGNNFFSLYFIKLKFIILLAEIVFGVYINASFWSFFLELKDLSHVISCVLSNDEYSPFDNIQVLCLDVFAYLSIIKKCFELFLWRVGVKFSYTSANPISVRASHNTKAYEIFISRISQSSPETLSTYYCIFSSFFLVMVLSYPLFPFSIINIFSRS